MSCLLRLSLAALWQRRGQAAMGWRGWARTRGVRQKGMIAAFGALTLAVMRSTALMAVVPRSAAAMAWSILSLLGMERVSLQSHCASTSTVSGNLPLMTSQWKLKILLCKAVWWRADLMHWCVPHKTMTTRAASRRVTQAKAGHLATGARS
eukprot:9039595-Ditylum_brightwellii.AAC.1